jgi:hypothetical protein
LSTHIPSLLNGSFCFELFSCICIFLLRTLMFVRLDNTQNGFRQTNFFQYKWWLSEEEVYYGLVQTYLHYIKFNLWHLRYGIEFLWVLKDLRYPNMNYFGHGRAREKTHQRSVCNRMTDSMVSNEIRTYSGKRQCFVVTRSAKHQIKLYMELKDTIED